MKKRKVEINWIEKEILVNFYGDTLYKLIFH